MTQLDAHQQLDQLSKQVDGALSRSHSVTGWSRLKDDIAQQIAGVDEVADRISASEPTNKQLWVRKAALVLLDLCDDGTLTSYKSMLSRGKDAPAQPQFIGLFANSEGTDAVAKTYGYDNENEVTALDAYSRAGISGVVKLLKGGKRNGNTFVVLEKVEGKSLTSYWGEHDRPQPPQTSIEETRQIATIISDMHDVALPNTGRIPHVKDLITENAAQAIGWLKDNGYGDLVESGAAEFARNAYDCAPEDEVLLVGEPFAANAMISSQGNVSVIDPTPRRGPRPFDGAFWVVHTAHPDRITGDVKAWLEGESDLDIRKFGQVLSAELLRHAGVLEIVKRENGKDWQTRDPETEALVKLANGVRRAAEADTINNADELVTVVESITANLGREAGGNDLSVASGFAG